MSEKIVVDALHSPSLVGELKNYHKDLVGQIAKRGVLVLLSGIFLLIQYAGFIFLINSSNDASLESDAVYGGFSSKQDAVVEYDRESSIFNQKLNALSITRDDLQKSTEIPLNTWLLSQSSPVIAWSKSPVYRLGYENNGPSPTNSTFFVTKDNAKFYGHSLDNQNPGPYRGAALHGNSAVSGNFAILLSSGNVLTTNSSPDICYENPGESLSYVHCSSSNTFRSEIMVTNLSYKNDAQYIKNRAGDRLQYNVKLTNQNPQAIELKPELYVGDLLEYSAITYVDNARFDKTTNILQWPQTTLQPNEQKILSFNVQILNPVPINPRGSTNTASYDCYMTSYFGSISNIKVSCPTPKILEKMLANPPSSSLLVIAWIIFIINTLLYVKIYISAKEHGLILKHIRRKHD